MGCMGWHGEGGEGVLGGVGRGGEGWGGVGRGGKGEPEAPAPSRPHKPPIQQHTGRAQSPQVHACPRVKHAPRTGPGCRDPCGAGGGGTGALTSGSGIEVARQVATTRKLHHDEHILIVLVDLRYGSHTCTKPHQVMSGRPARAGRGGRGGGTYPPAQRTASSRITLLWSRHVRMKNSRDTRSADPTLLMPLF